MPRPGSVGETRKSSVCGRTRRDVCSPRAAATRRRRHPGVPAGGGFCGPGATSSDRGAPPCEVLGGTAFFVVSSMSEAFRVRLSFAKQFTRWHAIGGARLMRRWRSGSRPLSPAPGPAARVAGRARAKPGGSRPVPPHRRRGRARPGPGGSSGPCRSAVRPPQQYRGQGLRSGRRPQPFDSVHRDAFGQRGSRMLSMTRVQLSPPCPFSIARW